VIQAHEEEVQDLQCQHQTESAGQRSQISDLQQCLAEKTQQVDRLATDHSNAVEVRFHMMYLLMQFAMSAKYINKLSCCPRQYWDDIQHAVSRCITSAPLVLLT